MQPYSSFINPCLNSFEYGILLSEQCHDKKKRGSNMTMEQVDRIIEEFEQLSVDELKAVSERFLESKRLSVDDLKAVSERILEEIEDREWDRLLSSPESIAEAEQERAKTMEAIATGDIM